LRERRWGAVLEINVNARRLVMRNVIFHKMIRHG
jgi:hypothetical protein